MTANILKHPHQPEPYKMELLSLQDYVDSIKQSAVALRLAISGTDMATPSHRDALESLAMQIVDGLATISGTVRKLRNGEGK